MDLEKKVKYFLALLSSINSIRHMRWRDKYWCKWMISWSTVIIHKTSEALITTVFDSIALFNIINVLQVRAPLFWFMRSSAVCKTHWQSTIVEAEHSFSDSCRHFALTQTWNLTVRSAPFFIVPCRVILYSLLSWVVVFGWKSAKATAFENGGGYFLAMVAFLLHWTSIEN